MLNVAQALNVEPGREDSQVIIEGNVHFYKDKAPFQKSGASLLGALEFDPENDLVKCHECGRWVRSIAAHLRFCSKANGMTAREYKKIHGFAATTVLITESTREKFIANGEQRYTTLKNYWEKRGDHSKFAAKLAQRRTKEKTHHKRVVESENARNACKPQVLQRIQKLAKQIGRTPTRAQLREVGIVYEDMVYHFGSMPNAMRAAGLRPRGKGIDPLYSRKHLLYLVKNFFETHGRRPTHSDLKRRLLPSKGTFLRYFSSGLRGANLAAGLGVDNWIVTNRMSDKELLQRFKRVIDALGHIPTKKDHLVMANKYGVPYSKIARRFTWSGALKKLGLEARVNQHTMTDKDAIASIHAFYRGEGRVPTTSRTDKIIRRKYGVPTARFFERHFGSLRKAIMAAGLSVGQHRFYAKPARTCFGQPNANDRRCKK